jgi:hypothetical protein
MVTRLTNTSQSGNKTKKPTQRVLRLWQNR